jgi:hypothetical protein
MRYICCTLLRLRPSPCHFYAFVPRPVPNPPETQRERGAQLAEMDLLERKVKKGQGEERKEEERKEEEKKSQESQQGLNLSLANGSSSSR